MIECAGAEYLKTDGTGIVWFRCRETGRICTVCEKKIIASEARNLGGPASPLQSPPPLASQ